MGDYHDSVVQAGGTPVPLTLSGSLPELLRTLDGVLLTGGGDVDPRLYGEKPHPTYGKAEAGRDLFEIELVRGAFATSLPMLGICRGMQVINVALGGTLIQDVPSQVSGAMTHDLGTPKDAIAHDVLVTRGSRLGRCLTRAGDVAAGVAVNSRHHQAVGLLAGGWIVSAIAQDGVIEAIEWQGPSFALAVQWHPENFCETGEFAGIFEHLLQAAVGRASSRVATISG